MTASRPAQVTQSEGEAERDGEKGGWAGQRKTEEQEEEGEREEEVESDRKDRGGRKRERGREKQRT